jgi:hypothetical protein
MLIELKSQQVVALALLLEQPFLVFSLLVLCLSCCYR